MNNNLNILFISYGSGIYGANSSLISLMTNLKNNHNVNPIVLTPQKGKFYNYLINNDYQVISHKWYNWVHNKDLNKIKLSIVLIRKLFSNFIYKRSILKKTKKNKIDIIHSNNSVTDIGLYLSKKLRKPHLWYFREFLEEDYNLKFDRGLCQTIKYIEKNSDAIVCNSYAIKEKFNNYFQQKLNVIYNGIDVKLFNKNNNQNNNQKGNKINFVLVGLISEGKNQIEAIKAVKHIYEEYGKRFRLYIVGNGSKIYYSKLINFIESNNISDNVIFKEYIENIPDFLRKMDVGIITSKNEAFGRVTVEYMLSRMPVIGAKSGGTKEIIKHGYTGFLYELGNYRMLGNYMKEFIDFNDKIHELGNLGYEEAISKYNINRYVEQIYHIFDSIVKKD